MLFDVEGRPQESRCQRRACLVGSAGFSGAPQAAVGQGAF